MPARTMIVQGSGGSGARNASDLLHRAFRGGRTVVLANQDLLPFALRLIGEAHHRVLAAVFIIDPRPEDDPDGTVRLLLDAMARAQWRGLDTRVLVGGSARTPAIELAGRVALKYLQAAGVPCRQFVGRRGETSLHSKYLIADDTVVVGSHNWTRRALAADNELSLAVTSASLVTALRFEFETDWRRAAEAEDVKPTVRDAEGGDR